jgi:hypothetical protein
MLGLRKQVIRQKKRRCNEKSSKCLLHCYCFVMLQPPSVRQENGFPSFLRRASNAVWHYKYLPFMFDWSVDPRAQLGILCLLTAITFWNSDLLFLLFFVLGICTCISRQA